MITIQVVYVHAAGGSYSARAFMGASPIPSLMIGHVSRCTGALDAAFAMARMVGPELVGKLIDDTAGQLSNENRRAMMPARPRRVRA